MKRSALFISCMAGLVLSGCGGGGAGVILPDTFAFLWVVLTNKDGLNLYNGESAQFSLTGLDNQGKYYYNVPASEWSMTNVTGNPGNFDTSNGHLQCVGPGTAKIRAKYNQQNAIEMDIVVHVNKAKITGKVMNSSGQALPNVFLQFYNDSNVKVGDAKSLSGGNFYVYVPVDATKVNLNKDKIPSGYLFEWKYKDKVYSSFIANCHAVMILSVALQINQTSNMPDPIIMFSNNSPPPPPPDGCF